MTDSLFSCLIENPLQCTVVVNNVEHQVPAQLSVAGALLYLGHRQVRQHSVSGEARATFCHMGVCFECLVTINKGQQQRACLQQVMPNMRIDTVTKELTQ